MSIVTFEFLFFLFASLIVFYLFPKKYRWLVLLGASIYFFVKACSWKLGLYLISGIIITYVGARIIDERCKKQKTKKITLIITLFGIVSQLFMLKYVNIFPLTGNMFLSVFDMDLQFGTFNFIAPLGISYYTLSLISYVVDVYWTTCKAEKNILKYALFACYYPSMISGPIIRYPQMRDEFFNEKKLDWNNIYQGFYRILYGLMKKLVIADALSAIVTKVFGNYEVYNSIFIIYGVICYAIQIYCDFSGCMDIIIGASKMYGVKLPENFDSPFFSKNLSEFWRRWHISLGLWGKDYIMYPLLKSSLFQNFGKKCKKIFGKKTGKKITTITAILILWLFIGLWHGASYKYIFAAGILPWIYLAVGELFSDIPEKLNKLLHINTKCFSFRLFQSIRTFLFMCLVWLFVCGEHLKDFFKIAKNIFKLPDINLKANLALIHPVVIVLMLVLVFIVDFLNYKKINAIEKFQEQNFLFRWIFMLIIISIILLCGCYGPNYSAVDFIYGGF